MKNKNKNKKIFNALLTLCAALVLMGGFSVTAYAQTPEGQDDATDDSGVVYEEPEKEEPLTPDGNATLVDDFGGNKQLITVTTKNGNYFYILIDRDDKGENTVHFLNQVDEADLMALMEDGNTATEPPTVCNCTEKCEAGKVNVDYVFNNVGFSSTSDLYSLSISKEVRERAEKTLAQRKEVQTEKAADPQSHTAEQPEQTETNEGSRVWTSPYVGGRKISHYGERDTGVCSCRRAAGKGRHPKARRGRYRAERQPF